MSKAILAWVQCDGAFGGGCSKGCHGYLLPWLHQPFRHQLPSSSIVDEFNDTQGRFIVKKTKTCQDTKTWVIKSETKTLFYGFMAWFSKLWSYVMFRYSFSYLASKIHTHFHTFGHLPRIHTNFCTESTPFSDFQTKIVKTYTHFSGQNSSKTIHLGFTCTYLQTEHVYSLWRGLPPPRGYIQL